MKDLVLVPVTLTSGYVVYVNPAQIAALTQAQDGTYIVLASGLAYEVAAAPDQVAAWFVGQSSTPATT